MDANQLVLPVSINVSCNSFKASGANHEGRNEAATDTECFCHFNSLECHRVGQYVNSSVAIEVSELPMFSHYYRRDSC